MTHIEGQVALRFKNLEDAAEASASFAVALKDFAETYNDNGKLDLEVVAVNLFQVTAVEEPDAVSE